MKYKNYLKCSNISDICFICEIKIKYCNSCCKQSCQYCGDNDWDILYIIISKFINKKDNGINYKTREKIIF